jgi:hypothetical protein
MPHSQSAQFISACPTVTKRHAAVAELLRNEWILAASNDDRYLPSRFLQLGLDSPA